MFNIDEKGLAKAQEPPSKVIVLQGRKQVSTFTLAARGTLVTAVMCMNAARTYVPPMLILRRVPMKVVFFTVALWQMNIFEN